MPSAPRKPLPRPSRATLVAGAVVAAGVLLTGLHWGWIALVGVGAFGPGVLRELGWLRDKDEFQREAARRAGYHGFLAAGLVGFLLTAFYRSHPDLSAHPGPPVELLLSVLWFTWLLSSLLSFWGPRRMARRMLLIFGLAWLLFVLAEGVGEGGVLGLLMHSTVVLPFFVLAWLAGRAPRVAGALLLAASVGFVLLFRLNRVVADPFAKGAIFVLIFFVGPLVTAGLGLLRRVADDEE